MTKTNRGRSQKVNRMGKIYLPGQLMDKQGDKKLRQKYIDAWNKLPVTKKELYNFMFDRFIKENERE
jgi:hypothetical protein